ncbi:MAG TPA: signal peptidase I [Modestobacter sp.]|nr:signal peptidase I [Modestobacter sp.]
MAHRHPGLTAPARRAAGARGPAGRAATVLAGLLVVLLAASVTGLLPVRVMRVGSGSMAPAVQTGDLVVVVPPSGPVQRRDVVAAPHPDTGVLLVKRVVAVGGDRVALEDGVLVVDGVAVCEPSIDPARLDGVWFGPVTVPAGRLFLLGDDRGESIDSRDFGPVPAAEVTGVVPARVWPSPGRLPREHC